MAYSESDKKKIVDEVCRRIESGDSLRKACDYGDLPDRHTIHEWIRKDEDVRHQYARACEVREDKFFDEMLDIADSDNMDATVSEDGQLIVDGQAVQRSKLRIDTRKWMLSKMNPKKYGDKTNIDHTTKGERISSIDLSNYTDEELRTLAALQRKGGASEEEPT